MSDARSGLEMALAELEDRELTGRDDKLADYGSAGRALARVAANLVEEQLPAVLRQVTAVVPLVGPLLDAAFGVIGNWFARREEAREASRRRSLRSMAYSTIQARFWREVQHDLTAIGYGPLLEMVSGLEWLGERPPQAADPKVTRTLWIGGGAAGGFASPRADRVRAQDANLTVEQAERLAVQGITLVNQRRGAPPGGWEWSQLYAGGPLYNRITGQTWTPTHLLTPEQVAELGIFFAGRGGAVMGHTGVPYPVTRDQAWAAWPLRWQAWGGDVPHALQVYQRAAWPGRVPQADAMWSWEPERPAPGGAKVPDALVWHDALGPLVADLGAADGLRWRRQYAAALWAAYVWQSVGPTDPAAGVAALEREYAAELAHLRRAGAMGPRPWFRPASCPPIPPMVRRMRPNLTEQSWCNLGQKRADLAWQAYIAEAGEAEVRRLAARGVLLPVEVGELRIGAAEQQAAVNLAVRNQQWQAEARRQQQPQQVQQPGGLQVNAAADLARVAAARGGGGAPVPPGGGGSGGGGGGVLVAVLGGLAAVTAIGVGLRAVRR